jgi:hypothetical protein
MRRGSGFSFSGEHRGVAIKVDFWGSEPKFTCDVLTEKDGVPKTFNDIEKMLDAIDRYELSLRKNFSNPTAYRLRGSYRECEDLKYEEVTVTSIVDERDCWIKTKEKPTYGSGREMERLENLFFDAQEVQDYIDLVKGAYKKFSHEKKKAEARLNMFRWKPEAK